MGATGARPRRGRNDEGAVMSLFTQDELGAVWSGSKYGRKAEAR
jgi:hypothetical protein